MHEGAALLGIAGDAARFTSPANTPEMIVAIGDELLENLLNEYSDRIATEVPHHLRTNKRFRQAFAFGNYSSVDPALISDWVAIFQQLGTTKDAERKSLRRASGVAVVMASRRFHQAQSE